MIAWPDGLDPARFVARHWQKSPALLPSALPGFAAPLTPDELAGLACEPEVEARIVAGDETAGWSVRHGPFSDDDFLGLGERDWTLLVQDVDKHLPELASLMSLVAFIPSWRRDDLMISYAAPGGTVGPHLDAYDVFLIQALGERHWWIDPSPTDTTWRDDCELRVLAQFQARETFDLQVGDILYLPPGVAHYGIGDQPSMTISVGFRAPTAGGLMAEAGHRLQEGDDQFYSDAALSPDEVSGGRISPQALERARGLLRRASRRAEDEIAEHLGRLVTRGKPWIVPLPREDGVSRETTADLLRGGARFRAHPGSRFAWCFEGERAWLFCDGEAWRLPGGAAEFCDALCKIEECVLGSLPSASEECVGLLVELIVQGSLEFVEERLA